MWGVDIMIEFIDETNERLGTDINRENLMAIQGFISKTTEFNSDGSIIETNSKGEKKITVFNSLGFQQIL